MKNETILLTVDQVLNELSTVYERFEKGVEDILINTPWDDNGYAKSKVIINNFNNQFCDLKQQAQTSFLTNKYLILWNLKIEDKNLSQININKCYYNLVSDLNSILIETFDLWQNAINDKRVNDRFIGK